MKYLNPLSANNTKWSNTLKQFVANLPTHCLSVFDHFVKLALKRLTFVVDKIMTWCSFPYSSSSLLHQTIKPRCQILVI